MFVLAFKYNKSFDNLQKRKLQYKKLHNKLNESKFYKKWIKQNRTEDKKKKKTDEEVSCVELYYQIPKRLLKIELLEEQTLLSWGLLQLFKERSRPLTFF